MATGLIDKPSTGSTASTSGPGTGSKPIETQRSLMGPTPSSAADIAGGALLFAVLGSLLSGPIGLVTGGMSWPIAHNVYRRILDRSNDNLGNVPKVE